MTSPMTLLAAAQHVLNQSGAPLHTGELTRQMLDGGLWTTQGRTPEASVYSALFMSLKRHGLSSPFVQTAPSTFGLRPISNVIVVPAAVAQQDQETAPSEDLAPVPVTKTFLDAAEAVLASLPPGQPMRIRELTETALSEGLLVTQGLTPVATMSAQLYQDIRRRAMRGQPMRFERHQNGFVSLHGGSGQAQTGTPDLAAEQSTPLQTVLLARLRAIDPRDLELLVEKLLAARGYVTVQVTAYSNDGGIDLRAEYTDGLMPERIAVQVKRQQANVGRPAIQSLRGSLATHERGLFVTTSSFTTGAREEAMRLTAAPIGLLAGEALAGLLIEHRIGVHEVDGELRLRDNLLEDPFTEPRLDAEDPHLSPLLRDRVAAGMCVSAINEKGGDANLWEIDDEVELRLSMEAMAELRVRPGMATE
ncbi:HTH domain-containing protein [Deinococcus humi]|uniref:Restriction system protein n=1 Tax=Deinococcus humi TaxID=662880 RepID=A0A7W8JYU3_9DEIO|nr:HTH domain-containing protein [Deinococcus humi]MBB5365752.1 restriction system protein [Deinococcus humi]GGO38346.1 hypothetical protein GCM10008949_44710 [Deinococcus humi]